MVLLHNVVLLCVIWGCVGWDYRDWSYSGETGPDFWSDISNVVHECDGSNQSPIDIDTLVTEVDTSLDALVFFQYNQQDVGRGTLDVDTDGAGEITPYVSINFDRIGEFHALTPTLSGGGLTNSYDLFSTYFHWGSVDTQGSEHRIDGRAYPMEVQFMHISDEYDYDYYAYGSGELDALAGLVVLFEISDEDNPTIGSVMTALIDAWQSGEDVDAFNLDLLLPTDLSDFYRYTGSKTFPLCEEIVVWTVFKETIPISSAQMEIIRTSVIDVNFVDSVVYVADNFRPPMPLNERTVFTTTPPPTTTPPTTTPPPTTVTTTLAPSEDANVQEDANENAQAVEFGDSTSRATLQHASVCVILVALVAVCQLF